jgi:hypothetical protein
MDKKTRKQIDVLRTRLKKLQRQLAGAEQQRADPSEVEELRRKLSSTLTALEQLTSSKSGP